MSMPLKEDEDEEMLSKKELVENTKKILVEGL